MFFSLLKPYESKVKAAKLDRVSVKGGAGRAIERIKLIKIKINAYKLNTSKTWIENVKYFDELTELMARLVSDFHAECLGMDGGKFAIGMETKTYNFLKKKIDCVYRCDQLDAELTRGEDVKYVSSRIPEVLDDLDAFIAAIEKDAQAYLERLQELIEAFSYAD